MSEGEFWGLTPRQLLALFDRRRDEHERATWRAAFICAGLANVTPFIKRPPEGFQPRHFMPETHAERPLRAVPHKDIINKARHAFAMVGFPVKEKARG